VATSHAHNPVVGLVVSYGTPIRAAFHDPWGLHPGPGTLAAIEHTRGSALRAATLLVMSISCEPFALRQIVIRRLAEGIVDSRLGTGVHYFLPRSKRAQEQRSPRPI
jgi:hypothetical protein